MYILGVHLMHTVPDPIGLVPLLDPFGPLLDPFWDPYFGGDAGRSNVYLIRIPLRGDMGRYTGNGVDPHTHGFTP